MKRFQSAPAWRVQPPWALHQRSCSRGQLAACEPTLLQSACVESAELCRAAGAENDQNSELVVAANLAALA